MGTDEAIELVWNVKYTPEVYDNGTRDRLVSNLENTLQWDT